MKLRFMEVQKLEDCVCYIQKRREENRDSENEKQTEKVQQLQVEDRFCAYDTLLLLILMGFRNFMVWVSREVRVLMM